MDTLLGSDSDEHSSREEDNGHVQDDDTNSELVRNEVLIYFGDPPRMRTHSNDGRKMSLVSHLGHPQHQPHPNTSSQLQENIVTIKEQA